ncbi:type IV pilin protein [Halopseudomonas bauzanensis]|nr:type IV pilin protein [Halopseudomonas bauzanensis]
MNNAMRRWSRGAAGFTLIELMIVVVIVAILAAIAYPSYTRYVQQTREAEAQGQIMELASALEAYRAKNFSYNGATAALSPELDSNEHYQAVVNVGASNQSYTVVATPQSSLMSGMAVLSYTSAGVASWE